MLLDPATAKVNLRKLLPDMTVDVFSSISPRIVKGQQQYAIRKAGAKVMLVSGVALNIYTPTAQALNLIRKQTVGENSSGCDCLDVTDALI